MTMRSMLYYFAKSKTSLIILAIGVLALGLGSGLTSLQSSTNAAPAQTTRTISVAATSACLGGVVDVPVSLTSPSPGDVNKVSFDLNFDSQVLTFDSATLGIDASGASLNLVPSISAVGVDITLPAGQTFPAGGAQVLAVRFIVKNPITVFTAQLSFSGESVLDTAGNPLAYTSTGAAVTVKKKPQVISLNPDFTNVGQALPQNRLQIRGLNFADGSRVLWKVPGEPGAGRPLPIESVSSDTISVVVTPNFFTVGIEAQVIVTSPQPCGGQDIIEFLILNPAPGIASVTPNQTNVATDNAPVTITVTGNNFVTNSKVLLGD